MDLVLEEKNATEWVYRGEGAANLVFAYTGSSPLFVGKVLRIQKVAKTKHGTYSILGPTTYSPQEKLLWKDYKELADSPTTEVAARIYLEQVMSPLLGSKHVDAGVPVHVTKEFMDVVEKSASSLRPTSRISAAGVNKRGRYALLISDHSCFPSCALKDEPCISVEIKPKCGFLPSSRYIAKRNDIKKTVTRFRMHQMLKLHDEEISKLSDYDPLDLFSGSKERMHKAIESLYNTPQNNFRIFINGSLVLGGLGGVGDTTTEAIRARVENELRVIIQANSGLRTKSFLELLVETIHESGVLDRLLKVQKLDDYDVEGAIHAYYTIMSQPCRVCRDMKDDKPTFSSLHSLSLDESLNVVKRFLMAATVKDCSLIMCFRRSNATDSGSSSDRIHLQSTDQHFEYKVFFIDLDLKPLEKMEHYYQLDQKIVSCYRDLVEKTTCTTCCFL